VAGRRGQAEPLTVMILVSATLVVALLLFSYFTGVYRGQQTSMGLVEYIGLYSNRLTVYMEAGLTGESPSGDYLYCDIVSLVNMGGDPLRAYVTVLPLARSGNYYTVGEEILYAPVDYQSPYAPVPIRTVYMWLLNDTDGDGIVETLGTGPGGGLEVVWETVPSCTTIYDAFTAGTLYDLALAPESDDPNLGVEASKIMLSPEGSSLADLVRMLVPAAPDNMYVPLWNITVPAGGKVQLYIYTMSQVPQDQRALAVMVLYEGRYYLALLQPLG